MTVAELGERMSSRELTEWMVYAGLEPFGADAEDARNAISTAAQVNATIAAAGGKKTVKAEQFLLGQRVTEEPDLYTKLRNNPLLAPRPKD